MKRLSATLLTACFLASAASAMEFTVAVTDEARIVRGFAVELDGADYASGWSWLATMLPVWSP